MKIEYSQKSLKDLKKFPQPERIPMKLNIYQIDTFTRNVFEGNPAAVVILEYWLDDKVM